MPNQLTISSINVVFSEDEDVTTAKDRPVRPGELEDLGVSKEFLIANEFEGKLQQTLLLSRQEGVVIALGLGDQPLTAAAVSYTHLTLPTICSV